MSLSTLVTKLRFMYHCEVIEVNNVLNQLHLRSDEKADMVAKNSLMTLVNDVFPRMGLDTSCFFKDEEGSE